MGKVAITYRILPAGADVDVAGLEASVRATFGAQVRAVAVRPIAFGLKALDATVVVDDAAGQAEGVERRLRGLDGVGELETVRVSLL